MKRNLGTIMEKAENRGARLTPEEAAFVAEASARAAEFALSNHMETKGMDENILDALCSGEMNLCCLAYDYRELVKD